MTIWNTEYMSTDVTYWGPPANDGYGGLTYPAPLSLFCRWEDKNEKVINAVGEEITSSAVVWPDQVLTLRGWLIRGTSLAADPRTVDGAYEIKAVQEIPELSGSLIEYKVWL